MDDAPDKVRRNLMAVSTAIILLWFLRAPLQGKIFWVLDLSNVESWRPWAAALAILAYCALRFHNEPATAKARAKEIESFNYYRLEAIEAYLFVFASRTLKKGKKQNKINPLAAPAQDFELTSLSATRDEHGRTIPPESRRVTLSWNIPNANPRSTKYMQGTFTLHWLDQPKIHVDALKNGKWFKWPALEFGLPYGLALIALLICIWSIYIHIKPV